MAFVKEYVSPLGRECYQLAIIKSESPIFSCRYLRKCINFF